MSCPASAVATETIVYVNAQFTCCWRETSENLFQEGRDECEEKKGEEDRWEDRKIGQFPNDPIFCGDDPITGKDNKDRTEDERPEKKTEC